MRDTKNGEDVHVPSQEERQKKAYRKYVLVWRAGAIANARAVPPRRDLVMKGNKKNGDAAAH